MPMEKSAADWTGLLRTWASLGAALTASRSLVPVDWSAAERMIVAVRPKMQADADRLRGLLKRSRERLKPLGEPFDLDLGLHRWLDGEREEAYSDWLEWVIRQARTPVRIFGLFGLDVPANLPQDATLEMKREVRVARGHTDREGRLDLVIYHRDQAILVVEVKKGDADGADTAKNAGYTQTHPSAERVLLVVSAEEEDYEGFQPCRWAIVCIHLRRLAIELHKDESIMAAAMVLAFVAAVEQNLLGFSADLVRSICQGNRVYFNASVVDHLEDFLDQAGNSNGA